MYETATNCRSCGSANLDFALSLGDQLVVGFPFPGDPLPDRVPLDLLMCRDCALVQLRHSVNRDQLYKTYWYRSGMNQTMKNILREVVISAQEMVPLAPGDTIIDIGSNDGTLATFYPETVCKVGFEPSRNLWEDSQENVKWTKVYNDYFSHKDDLQAKIITSCAMFYDLDDPSTFVQDICKSLAPGGVWVDQQNYLGLMLKEKTYDNISHEHVAYYSQRTFSELLARNGMTVVKAELNTTNGGSMRSYVKRTCDVTEDIQVRVFDEEEGLDSLATYQAFYADIDKTRQDLYNFVAQENAQGKTFYVYGASTRGQIILQFCGLGPDLISGASEKNVEKVGRLTCGIPIYDEQYVRSQAPDYMIVLPYFFKQEFIKREQEYVNKGGKLIFPLPVMEIIG